MSWIFNTAPPSAPGELLHPPSDRFPSSDLFGPLSTEDLEWAQAGGFVTETQTFYTTLPGGKLLMSQVIHSAVGMYWPQIQFTFRYYDPTTSPPTVFWKSVPVTHFTVPATPKHDRRSAKSDQFSILVDPSTPDTYTISGQYENAVQVNLTFRRSPNVPGWKVGKGPEGGMTYFGAKGAGAKAGAEGKPHTTGGADGYVVHRFWPRCEVGGIVVVEGKMIEVGKGSGGCFIHAIQGMRPNLIAASWNFANFQTVNGTGDEGESALTMMEFTTPDNYGAVTVNVGSVVLDGKLVSVTVGKKTKGVPAEKEGGVVSLCSHQEQVFDPFTTYKAPGTILYEWKAPSVDGSGRKEVKAELKLELEPKLVEGKPDTDAGRLESKGLIEKVDVLGEIPYLVKKVVAYAAGTKPYIYQWFNQTKATVEIDGEKRELDGYLFNEATFISENA